MWAQREKDTWETAEELECSCACKKHMHVRVKEEKELLLLKEHVMGVSAKTAAELVSYRALSRSLSLARTLSFSHTNAHALSELCHMF